MTKQGITQQLEKDFVYIQSIVPTIALEMRYAGTNNFIGKPIKGYINPVGIVSEETAFALKKVQKSLQKKGLGLKIFDAYRPQRAVDHFAAWALDLNDTIQKHLFYPDVRKSELFDKGYISYKSGHTRGSTVDLTIIDLKSNKELDMGFPYDFFGKESWVAYDKLTKKQLKNRQLLQQVMLNNGFKNYAKEWWHFTLMNEPFPDTYFNFPIE